MSLVYVIASVIAAFCVIAEIVQGRDPSHSIIMALAFLILAYLANNKEEHNAVSTLIDPIDSIESITSSDYDAWKCGSVLTKVEGVDGKDSEFSTVWSVGIEYNKEQDNGKPNQS